MLDKNDIRLLSEMFDQKLSDFKVEVRDEIRSCISASEFRIMRMMHEMKEDILDGVADMVTGQIIPQIDDHESRLVRLEHHVA